MLVASAGLVRGDCGLGVTRRRRGLDPVLCGLLLPELEARLCGLTPRGLREEVCCEWRDLVSLSRLFAFTCDWASKVIAAGGCGEGGRVG